MAIETEASRDFPERVLGLFECGLDTAEIATRLGIPEARIERALHAGLARRKERKSPMEPA